MPLGDFSYQRTKDGGVRIAFNGKVVTTLSGKHAARFLARAEPAGEEERQHLMARATGNFKRGNERTVN